MKKENPSRSIRWILFLSASLLAAVGYGKTYDHYVIIRAVHVEESWLTFVHNGGGFSQAMPTKENDSVKVYDVAIWEDGDAIHVYDFDNTYQPYVLDPYGTPESWTEHRESFLMKAYKGMPQTPRSASRSRFIRNSFIDFFKDIVAKHPDSGYIYIVNGHGGPGGEMFAFNMTPEDSFEMLQSWVTTLGGKLDCIDFGGPCVKSSIGDLATFTPFCDYYVASDLPNGGYTFDNYVHEDNIGTDVDYQYPLILNSSEDLESILTKRIQLKRERYLLSKNNMIQNKVEQANYLFNSEKAQLFLRDFVPFWKGNGSPQMQDARTFVKNAGQQSIVQKLDDMIIASADNKDFFNWEVTRNCCLSWVDEFVTADIKSSPSDLLNWADGYYTLLRDSMLKLQMFGDVISEPKFVVTGGSNITQNSTALQLSLNSNYTIRASGIASAEPDKPVLISPTGSLDSGQVTFQWEVFEGATEYLLFVSNGISTVLSNWYLSSDVENGGTASITPTSSFASGSYEWWIQAKTSDGKSDWSDGLKFEVSFSSPPGVATLKSPSGAITTDSPDFVWDKVEDSTWYYLWVSNKSGAFHAKWYTASEADNGDDCLINPGLDLAAGEYQWWVQTYNEAGKGDWSNGKTFVVQNDSVSPPVAAVLSSPSGAISETNPIFKWNKVEGSTWYYLWVSKGGEVALKKWYTASSVDGGDHCEIQPDLNLDSGDYQWWIQTYNDAGTGAWSSGMPFSIELETAPATATLISPSGSSTQKSPVFEWEKVDGATWYYLWVNNGSGAVFKKWFTASEVDNGDKCQIQPDLDLAGGTYHWWIQTYNDTGYGGWSEGMQFSIETSSGLPGTASLKSPSGSINQSNPTFAWDKVEVSTWYYLWINDENGNIFKKWYQSSEVENGVDCSITPPLDLGSGNYEWWVQTYNDIGYGPWSSGATFTIGSI